jgi:hypothetical protein
MGAEGVLMLSGRAWFGLAGVKVGSDRWTSGLLEARDSGAASTTEGKRVREAREEFNCVGREACPRSVLVLSTGALEDAQVRAGVAEKKPAEDCRLSSSEDCVG